MTLDDFCTKLSKLDLTHAELALAILWYHDEKTPDVLMSAGELAKIISKSGLGVPHGTKLRDAVRKTQKVIMTKSGMHLNTTAQLLIGR